MTRIGLTGRGNSVAAAPASSPAVAQPTDGTPVFFVEHTDRVALSLRRYSSRADRACAKPGHYCNGMVFLCEAPAVRDAQGYYEERKDGVPRHDPRWPKKCDKCAAPFSDEDPYQVFQDAIMRAPATGQEWRFRQLPPGACYNAYWDDHHIGADGRSLVVILPTGHPWHIDSRASNCTLPKDNVHRCWCRHGAPEDGTLHVDKDGNTCAAGAGSIAVQGYHGFLHNGRLTVG